MKFTQHTFRSEMTAEKDRIGCQHEYNYSSWLTKSHWKKTVLHDRSGKGFQDLLFSLFFFSFVLKANIKYNFFLFITLSEGFLFFCSADLP